METPDEQTYEHTGLRCRCSDARVPLVALVFPVAALPFADARETFDELEAHHVFRVLVAELPLDAQPDRRAVRYGQRLVVQRVCEQRLLVVCLLYTSPSPR